MCMCVGTRVSIPLVCYNHIFYGLMQSFRGGEKILDRQRFQFPPDWIYIDHVEGEWGAVVEIMKRKDAAVQTQVRMWFMPS